MSGEFTPPPPSVVAVQGPDAPEQLKRLIDPRDYQVHARGDIALAAGSQRHIRVETGSDSVTVWLGRAVPEDASTTAAAESERAFAHGEVERLARLRGTWAALRADWGRRELAAACDLLGVRGLYMREHEGCRLLSDRADALARAGAPAVDPLGLAAWMHTGQPLGRRTMFQGIQRLDAASIVRFAGGRMQSLPYWQPDAAEEPINEAELADCILGDFRVSLRDLTRGLAAATVLLSGGHDSRLCLLTALEQGLPLKAATVPYTDAERDTVHRLAALCGIECREAPVGRCLWDRFGSLWSLHADGFPVRRNLAWLCARPGGEPFLEGSHSDAVLCAYAPGPGPGEPAGEAAVREHLWRSYATQKPALFLRAPAVSAMQALARAAADEQSALLPRDSKFCLRWGVATDERRMTPNNYLQYEHLGESLHPFYSRALLERRLRHPSALFTRDLYRRILARLSPAAAELPRANDLPAGRDATRAFSWRYWRMLPALAAFARRNRQALRASFLLPRLGAYGLGRWGQLYLVAGLGRLWALEQYLRTLGMDLDFAAAASAAGR